MEKTRIAIIGAGVCGLATAYRLSREHKGILVIEKYPSFGQETSSRNSEVIHAGIYYPSGSLKARCCVRGKELLYALCREHNIPHKKLGKILAACNADEAQQLNGIQKNAAACGVGNLRFIDQGELQRLEPDVKAQEALLCPDTGIVDSHQLMKFFMEAAKANGVEFAFGIEAVGIKKTSGGYAVTVKEPRGELFSFTARFVVNAAGLHADKISAMAGMDVERLRYKIHFNKGQYFRLNNPRKFRLTRPIYPPPSKTDLGIHITPDLAGGLRLGPDARYVASLDYQINEADQEKFYASVARFLPALTRDDLSPDTVGIRAKLQAPNEDFRDFVIEEESTKGFEGLVNLLGIESPGLTSCLAIAEKVKGFLDALDH